MNQEDIIQVLRENGRLDVHMIAALFHPDDCPYEIKHDTQSKVYAKLQALRKYGIVRQCVPIEGQRSMWELTEGCRTPLSYWDELKEAVRSGLITGEIIVKGQGKMTLKSLIAHMEGQR